MDDLRDPGRPSVKADWHRGVGELFQGPDHPENAFEIDAIRYWVQSRVIHGTDVVVAIHNSLVGITDLQGWRVPTAQEFAESVFSAFHHHWHRFGGYPYDRYTLKVKSMTDTPSFSLSRVGVALGRFSGQGGPDGAPHPFVDRWYYEMPFHEMFHSWNGKLIIREPTRDGRVFAVETWIEEGSTVYYTKRVRGVLRGLRDYQNQMRGLWNQYIRMVGTEFDLSIPDLTVKIGGSGQEGPPPPSGYADMLHARSLLLNYMLDLELLKAGTSLDALMQYLYVHFGLTERKWSQQDILVALEALTGRRFDQFFNTYLHSNTLLPLDGNFEFLEH